MSFLINQHGGVAPTVHIVNTWTRKTASMCGGYICSLLYRKSVSNSVTTLERKNKAVPADFPVL